MFSVYLNEFRDLIKRVLTRQDELQNQLDQILEKVMCSELTVKQTDAKFAACANAFRQIKEAVEILHENLDESCGKITEMTWNP